MRTTLSVAMLGALTVLLGCGGGAEIDKMRQAEKDARDKAIKTAADTNKAQAEAMKGTPGEPKEEPKEDKKEDPKPNPPETAPAGDRQTVTAGTRTLIAPKSWKVETPSSNMRTAQLKIPKAEGDTEDAELAVFKLGGGVDANVKRWAGQFGGDNSMKSKKTLKTASGDEATVVEYEGTYTAMTMSGTGEPKAGYKMMAAIIPTKDGGEFQIKMPGPAKTIDASKADFERLVESFK